MFDGSVPPRTLVLLVIGLLAAACRKKTVTLDLYSIVEGASATG